MFYRALCVPAYFSKKNIKKDPFGVISALLGNIMRLLRWHGECRVQAQDRYLSSF